MAVISYSDVLDHQLLPIDAQDVVTKVILVIAGNQAGREPSESYTALTTDVPWTYVDHFPEPITYEYTAPQHATYGATRSFGLPEGTNPFLDPTDPLIPEPIATGIVNPGDPSAVRDGDPLTYAEWEGGPFDTAALAFRLMTDSVASLCAGFRFKYALTGTTAHPKHQNISTLQYHEVPFAGTTHILTQRNFLLSTTEAIDKPIDLYAVSPWDARGVAGNHISPVYSKRTIIGLTINLVQDAKLRVYEFYPLILNEALLEDIAKSNIRLPAQLPQRVTVRGYVAPDREHTIQGWPGGDYTGVVAQVQYELGRTVIDFEEAGAPIGVPAEAVEAERVRVARTAASIDRAAYGLKMGERQ